MANRTPLPAHRHPPGDGDIVMLPDGPHRLEVVAIQDLPEHLALHGLHSVPAPWSPSTAGRPKPYQTGKWYWPPLLFCEQDREQQ